MKQYIKDGKIYNTPIRIEENEKIIYTNDDEIIKQNGYEEYVYTVPEKTIKQLISESDERINGLTDQKILNDFIFMSELFYLTMENQTNFANMYIARDHLRFPQLVKTKTGFYEIKNRFECERFYLAGINFVKNCLLEGWKRKAEAAEKIKAEYSE